MMQFQTTCEFEDLPLGVETLSGIEWTFEARAWGRAIVEYDGAGEWRIGDIEIATTREIAAAGSRRSWVEGFAWLDRKSPLYTLITAALLKHESERIEEKIVAVAEPPRFDAQREWGIHILGNAARGRLADGRIIEAKTVNRKPYAVAATSYRAIKVKEAKR